MRALQTLDCGFKTCDAHSFLFKIPTLIRYRIVKVITYYAKKNPFIDVTAVPHLPECSMTLRV